HQRGLADGHDHDRRHRRQERHPDAGCGRGSSGGRRHSARSALAIRPQAFSPGADDVIGRDAGHAAFGFGIWRGIRAAATTRDWRNRRVDYRAAALADRDADGLCNVTKRRLTKMRMKVFATPLVVGVLFCVAPAQERKINRSQLPPAVEQTVARESAGATIKGFATEVEHGQKLYEASLVVNGHTKDILIDRQGNIVEVEEQVSIDSLPAT